LLRGFAPALAGGDKYRLPEPKYGPEIYTWTYHCVIIFFLLVTLE